MNNLHKNNKPTCQLCEKPLQTLQIITGRCKCTKIFCKEHCIPEKHLCDFNYKLKYQTILSSNMPHIIASKIIKI
jgi:predicted nucleic acid binding AN1-type Zn finger protein